MTHKQHMGRGSSATTMEISCTVAVCMISLFVCMVNASSSNLQLDVVESVADFRYQISLKGKLWFNSGPVSVRWNGSWYSTDDETLKLHNSSQFDGEDVWGKFQSMKQWWMSAEGSFSYVTYINKYYNDSVYVFVQEFLDGTDNASTGDDSQTISSFPSFLVEDLGLQRGYITWHGNQDKYLVADKWSSSVPVYGRPDGGLPLVIFDQDLQNTAVISPLTNFIEATQGTWYPKSANAPAVGIGLIGTVDSVPPKYAFKSVLVAGENITGTMAKWGSLMRRMYSKDSSYRKTDYSINYLGYWTDNGACYYYNTGSYSNYEEAIIAVKEDADKQGIPFKYLQLDSWWYYKGVGNGVKNWTAMADVFPRGIEYVVQKTGWPIVAHNRFWSSNTDYAKQNGGDYDFVVDGNFALPNDSSFWHFLLSSSQQQWNLWVYEQDWLDTEYEGLKELRSDLFLGQTWLRQMGEAAQELGLTIQYCMPWPRHIMQSLEMPAVTQVRVSDDYRPGNTQWQIGHTTMLAHALGLAAFKDNFHTSEDQSKQGCKTPPEPYPALETYVTAMSGGPIGPSDAVGGANKTLIMATCMTDGRLLKPTRPGMLMDRTYIARAFGSDNGPDGELYVAYTEVSLGYSFISYSDV